MRKREREKLAEQIREVTCTLHHLLKEAAKAGMEVEGANLWLGDWHEEDRIRLRITYPAVEEL